MNFSRKREGYLYGHVKGFSMWPCLIPGDILRARRTGIDYVSEGDIVVMDHETERPVVHRLVRKEHKKDGAVILITAGDRSGQDPPRIIDSKGELLRVSGVLRSGKWKRYRSSSNRSFRRIPHFFVKLHCELVRRFWW